METTEAGIAAVSIIGAALAAWLFASYGVSDSRRRLSIVATDIPYTTRGLALSSALALYLELLLIRWVSSEIRIFAYFKNFVLIACFLGFGLGCYVCRRPMRLISVIAPLIFLTMLIAVPWEPVRSVVDALPSLLGSTSEMQIWGVANPATQLHDLMLASAVTLPLFALIALTFVPLGQLVGFHLEQAPNGVTAYTVNVLASLGGIALYTALCFASQPPAVWFIVAAILAAALFYPLPAGRVAVPAVLLLCGAALSLSTGPGSTFWSPYQKLIVTPNVERGERVGYSLQTNGSWYQKVVNLSPEFVASHPASFREVPIQLNAYNLPYRFAPSPRSVLILGSGMGNDVAAALRNGAAKVTAVEIDPLIIKLGRQLHPEHPYQSPRVTTVLADARNYIQNADAKFDLIVFSLLDSHTTSSHFSNIRIDNYVYTREALTAARRLLAPDGTFIVKFQVNKPWIAGRLNALMTDVFAQPPFQLQSFTSPTETPGRFFVSAPAPRITAALSDAEFRAAFVKAGRRKWMQPAIETTDDWPYFYQRDRTIPASVAVISLLLIVASIAGGRAIGLTVRTMQWEFFLLGAGFLLLESQIVSRMALLFGTTWVVNSIVIAAILLLIVAANGASVVVKRFPVAAGYAGILAAIVASLAIPLQAFFFRSFTLRAIVASLFLSLPVFFAGLVFIRRFAEAGFAGEAIGANLLGALAGGILESISLWLGLRSLLIVAALLYAAAWAVSLARVRAPGVTAEPRAA